MVQNLALDPEPVYEVLDPIDEDVPYYITPNNSTRHSNHTTSRAGEERQEDNGYRYLTMMPDTPNMPDIIPDMIPNVTQDDTPNTLEC